MHKMHINIKLCVAVLCFCLIFLLTISQCMCVCARALQHNHSQSCSLWWTGRSCLNPFSIFAQFFCCFLVCSVSWESCIVQCPFLECMHRFQAFIKMGSKHAERVCSTTLNLRTDSISNYGCWHGINKNRLIFDLALQRGMWTSELKRARAIRILDCIRGNNRAYYCLSEWYSTRFDMHW